MKLQFVQVVALEKVNVLVQVYANVNQVILVPPANNTSVQEWLSITLHLFVQRQVFVVDQTLVFATMVLVERSVNLPLVMEF